MKEKITRTSIIGMLAIFLLLLLPMVAMATPAEGAPVINGAELGFIWAMPFALMLLSIAVAPMVIPKIWEDHFGKIAIFWACTFIVPYAVIYGAQAALFQILHTMLLEYIPFIILLFALFTISGGIRVTGSLAGTPAVNATILLLGTCLASFMGTTGAAMLLIRPLLRANAHRKHRAHTVVFFIFLVANIGGSLTPLGDPPLFLGFLKGVDFFWTLQNVWKETLFMVGILLPLYFIIDTIQYKKEGSPTLPGDKEGLGIEGKVNFLFLAGVVLSVLMSGAWKPVTHFTVFYLDLEPQNILRDLLLLTMAGLSWKFTTKAVREHNQFSWEPIQEVAKVFLGIFLSMIPAIAILRAGEQGALRDLIALVTTPEGEPINAAYFWLTGALSSVLDNAPTYLVFFNTAGGDAATLMHETSTLAAISIGAVFMGANTYIGNAPNFMVRSIAASSGVKMPTFIGYFLIALITLIPCFLLITYIFF